MRAYVIVDLGFGDAGKGLLTDFLVRHTNAGLVIRYNGGAQAGHNVVTPDGRHHTFSQFGSGTFVPHVRTYLSRHVVVDPLALLVEGDTLTGKGVQDVFSRLRISDQALVITPFQRAVNRIRELTRGVNKHGSCGMGVGETFEDALSYPEISILAGDLNRPTLLRKKLKTIRDLKLKQLTAFCDDYSFDPSRVQDFEVFEDAGLADKWIDSTARVNELDLVASDSNLVDWFRGVNNVVFEGAQGVLLDADAGFHPYTTWSRCTDANAIDLIEQVIPNADVFRIGLLRAYAVRHGAGPLPTEADGLASLVSEHNQRNDWQDSVRYGWFDPVLAHYALSVTGGVDALAITHMDILQHLEDWKYCTGYIHENEPADTLTNPHHLSHLSLAEREQFTQALMKATPILNSINADDEAVIQTIERLVGQRVGIVSRGPSAENIQIIKPFSS